jgi:pimeloyl-ACP methyl ester carboxylesterase
MAAVTVPSNNPIEYVEDRVRVDRVFNGGMLPFDEDYSRSQAQAYADRVIDPANGQGGARHFAALLASEGQREALRTLSIPALVIQGEADPVFSIEHGEDTEGASPDAKLAVVPRAGHFLCPALFSDIADLIVNHVSNGGH